jgi:exonuclease SbcC
MIPTRLTLKNFLSYGDDVPELDFTSFHVACISGGNGHGKSALLDAITWALWGEARKAATDRKPDEGLLRIGTTDMQVTFEFRLEDEQYRVTRSFRKTPRAGSTSLELQVYSPESDSYKALSEEGSLRKTQERLNALLRMGYDTFINSAFILQGRADEFTRRNARDRKAILGEILGLSRYDDLATLARSRVQTADFEIAKARERLADIESAVAEIDSLQDELTDTSCKLAEFDTEITEEDTTLEALRGEKSRIALLRQEAAALSENLLRLEAEAKLATEQVAASKQESDACNKIMNARDEILADFEKFQVLQSKEERLREIQQKFHSLEKQQSYLEREITVQHHEVERRRDHWDRQVSEIKNQIDQAQRDKKEIFQRNLIDLERKVEGAKSELNVKLKNEQDQEARLAKLSDAKPGLIRRLEDAQKELDRIQNLEQERDRTREAGNNANLKIETARQRRSALSSEQQKIHQQRGVLTDTEEPNCPLCGSNLDPKHRAEVLSELDARLAEFLTETAQSEASSREAEAERDTHRRHYQEVKNQIGGLEETARTSARLEAELKAAEQACDELALIRQSVRELETALAEQTGHESATAVCDAGQELESLKHNAEAHPAIVSQLSELGFYEERASSLLVLEEQRRALQERLLEAKEKCDTAKLWLTEKRYAKKELDDLEKIQTEIKTLGYDTRHHREVTDQLAALHESPGAKERLLAAERQHEGAETRLESAQNRVAQIEEQRHQAVKRAEELGISIRASAELEIKIEKQQMQIASLRGTREQQLRTQASLQSRLADCQKKEATMPSEMARLKSAERTARIHRELITAFGKDGIQALIIEQAIPEIEEEANRILSRLTDNRTQITLESLRDLKKGGTRETLDIRISDELGERSYELYSGGEAFRVDFATRIALSRLLARRAGTRLCTLVIDEGFGTQDEEGLDSLIEAIQTISEDFEKILVITHVQSLKQAFPVQIEVTKYPDSGSRFEIHT